MMRIGLYPGTFDPVTNGHLDVLQRACRLFDEIIIAVATNEHKRPIFSLDERVQLFRENVQIFPQTQVRKLEGLSVDFAEKVGAIAIIRGLRAISDFEYEFQMTQMNRYINEPIETIFLMPSQEYFYTSSHIVKQVCAHNVSCVSRFVPPNVLEALKKRF